MKNETLKDYATILQSVAITLSLVLAGLWALYEFKVSRIRTLDLELVTNKIDDLDNLYAIETILKIKNNGNTDVDLKLEQDALIATRIEFDDKGNIKQTDERYTTPLYSFRQLDRYANYVAGIHVPPLTQKDLKFALKVKNPGIYFIQFNSFNDSENRFWQADSLIYVK